MSTYRKVMAYLAISLDGFIAGPEDDLSFLDRANSPGEDYGYEAFIQTVDTVIMGRRTWEKVLSFGIEFPHRERVCWILTRSPQTDHDRQYFHAGPLAELVAQLREQPGKHIYADGGQVVNGLLADGLLDELVLSVIPVLIGRGIPLFQANRPQQNLALKHTRTYTSGVVQLHYACVHRTAPPQNDPSSTP